MLSSYDVHVCMYVLLSAAHSKIPPMTQKWE